jgi:ankyrin repeat protein
VSSAAKSLSFQTNETSLPSRYRWIFTDLINASSHSIDLNTKLSDHGSTMLLQASSIGHDGIVRILLERGVDVNLADERNRTALSWASESGHDSVVKLLLQVDGIGINSKDGTYRQTALSWTSGDDRNSVVTLLLQGDGIDINSKNNIGWTALTWASENGHDSVVKLLLQMGGIDINSKGNNGRTTLS